MKGPILWQNEWIRFVEVEDKESNGQRWWEHRPGFRLRFERVYGVDSQGVKAWVDLDEKDGEDVLRCLYAVAMGLERLRPREATP